MRRAVLRKEGNSLASPFGAKRLQTLSRDLLGRTSFDEVDLNANSDRIDGPPDSTEWGEMEDTRTFNKRNELRTRVVKDSSNTPTGKTVTLTYDKNGNLTSDM